MEAQERRVKLLGLLCGSEKPVSGTKLAEFLGVSRQVIVQDIALLRAKGTEILATPQGYIMAAGLMGRPKRVFAVQHGPQEIEEELETIIVLGGKVLDVIVEHPLYGELKGLLMLASITDLREYMDKYSQYQAEPLSALTRGVHLHTVEADDEKRLMMIAKGLKNKGFLLEEI